MHTVQVLSVFPRTCRSAHDPSVVSVSTYRSKPPTLIYKIRLTHVPSKPPCRLFIFFFVFHVSEAFSSNERMLDLYIFSVLVEFQMLVSLPILVKISFTSLLSVENPPLVLFSH